MINTLINLFDRAHSDTNTIINYIEGERKRNGLDASNTMIYSDVYGHDRANSALCVDIHKKTKNLFI
jgi:hypothetical protein